MAPFLFIVTTMITSKQLTLLLSSIANIYEANERNGTRMKPLYQRKYLEYKFPYLTEAQVKHILRII